MKREGSKRLKHRVSLIFDGGSIGNPGTAYGSYLLRGKILPESGPKRLRFGQGTNNEAEYKSLIAGLRDLEESLERLGFDPAEVRLHIMGDSQLVLNQVSGEWKAKNPRMRSLRDKARRYLSPFGMVKLEHHDRRKSVRLLGH